MQSAICISAVFPAPSISMLSLPGMVFSSSADHMLWLLQAFLVAAHAPFQHPSCICPDRRTKRISGGGLACRRTSGKRKEHQERDRTQHSHIIHNTQNVLRRFSIYGCERNRKIEANMKSYARACGVTVSAGCGTSQIRPRRTTSTREARRARRRCRHRVWG